MSTTEHVRIRRHYKACRRRWGKAEDTNAGTMWLHLARTWKRPVQEIKRIVREAPHDR